MRRLVLVVVFLLFCSGDVLAGVRVTFHIGPDEMRSQYNPNPTRTEEDIVNALIPQLKIYLPQWTYGTSGAADWTLAFDVRKPEYSTVHTFYVVLKNGNNVIKTWDGIWLGPGELSAQQGYPSRADVAQSVAMKIGEKVLAVNQETLFEAMRAVPLASGGQWLQTTGPREEPRLVLPLRWQDGSVLNSSTVRVVCDWPAQGDTAELRSRAMTKSALYVDEVTHERYEALVVKPMKRVYNEEEKAVREIVGEVKQLVPIRAYLLSFQSPITLAGSN
jgi:hypothetical protein